MLKINGIEIRDIKDIEDVLTALETIKLELENASEKMDENFSNYNIVSNNLSKSAITQKSLIEGISNLQIKGDSLLSDLNLLDSNIRIANITTIENLREEFRDFNNRIETTLSRVVNGIDLSAFKLQIERLFNSKINDLESQVKRLNSNIKNLDEVNNKLQRAIEFNRENLVDAIDDFNQLSKVVNWKVITITLLGGMIVGALIMGLFSFSFLKDKMFKDEQTAIKLYSVAKIEMIDRYKNSENLQKFLNDNGIKIKYDKFSNTRTPFLMFKINQLGDNSVNFDRDGNRFIGFKENLSDLNI